MAPGQWEEIVRGALPRGEFRIASRCYRFDPEEPWQVYVDPFYVTDANTGTLYVHAHRIGFEPSAIDTVRLERVSTTPTSGPVR